MTKNNVLHRARIIEGHIKKVVNMIESKDYCIDILNQSAAVQSALRKLDELILEDHLNGCVLHQIKAGKAKEATNEVLQVFKRRA
jgi:DNA-binding FrmR family transcriptional regulator